MGVIFDWFLAFLAVFTLDLCWAFYVKGLQANNAWKAGGWAAILFVVAAFATIFYVKDPWLIIPSAIGAFVGTAVAVWWEKRNREIPLSTQLANWLWTGSIDGLGPR